MTVVNEEENPMFTGGSMDDELSVQDALIRRWQEEAAELDARAAWARAAGQEGRFQIHGWETRAQALRDCATELWQLAAEEDDVVDAVIHAADCMNPDCAGECEQCPCGKPIIHTEFCYGEGPQAVAEEGVTP